MKKNIKDISFEDAFKQQNKIVESIESEDNSLENMISLFEEGMMLTAICKERLNKAEKKILSVTKKNKIN